MTKITEARVNKFMNVLKKFEAGVTLYSEKALIMSEKDLKKYGREIIKKALKASDNVLTGSEDK